MSIYQKMSMEDLQKTKEEIMNAYNELKEKGLALDMSRGKPSGKNVDVCMDMLDVLNSSSDCKASDGTDVRNYGGLEGIPEARKLLADMLNTAPENVIVGGNASLTLMHDTIARAYTHGLVGSKMPWCKEEKLKFLCPAPGYDRHFAITEFFGFELITIPMTETGPDMDIVEKHVSDPAVKGIWCVPKYSNPQGITYSDETVKRLAALKPAAPDFRIMWDNAYVVHDLYDTTEPLLDILSECEKAANPNMVFQFASTSKVTFPGSGISCIAASKENIDDIKKKIFYQTIGPDKLNMLRHARYFTGDNTIAKNMAKIADILRPKFEAVLNKLDEHLENTDIATWTKPRGGYFISFDAYPGTAKEVVKLCAEAGVKLTPAGATFPYGKDPEDKNIRIAPSFPTVDELKAACDLFCTSVKLAAVSKEIENRK